MTPELEELAARSPQIVEAYDTSTPEFDDYVDEVDEVCASITDPHPQLDRKVRTLDPGAIGLLVALKLVESRRIVRSLTAPVTVTLVNPVYKETGRMQPRGRHPHGEDSIRYKVGALRRLAALNPMLRTRFVVVDDECPDGSGAMAEAILGHYDEYDRHDFVVHHLGAAIDAADPDVPAGLTHKSGDNRSVKGGALLYAMRRELRRDVGRHVLVDSDADLSIGPGQLGLLLAPIDAGSAQVVAGSRREPDSVAVIGGSRNSRGRLYIRIWQQLLPELAVSITDTNRAFKAFEADALRAVIADIRTYTFPYQVELLQACVAASIPLVPRAIAYVDSEAASTQEGEDATETYLHQLRQIIDVALRYRAVAPDHPLIRFIDEVNDDATWLEIECDPPAELLGLLG